MLNLIIIMLNLFIVMLNLFQHLVQTKSLSVRVSRLQTSGCIENHTQTLVMRNLIIVMLNSFQHLFVIVKLKIFST